MTDDHTDTDLDHRIRSGLAALVAEAPDPPPLPDAPATGDGRRSFMLAAAVVLVLLAVGAVVLSAATDDEGEGVVADGPPTAPAGDASLFGTVWTLEEMSGPGTLSFTRGDPETATLTFANASCRAGGDCSDEPSMVGQSPCRSFEATISVEGQVVEIQDGASDALAAPECDGPTADLVNVDLVGGIPVPFDPFTYAIDGDRLRITSTDGRTELVYRAAGS